MSDLPTTGGPALNPNIGEVIARRLRQRRELLKGGAGVAMLSMFGASLVPGCAPVPRRTAAPAEMKPTRPEKLGFDAVAKSLADAVIVPAGYSASVLYRLGDPIAVGVPEYANDGTDAAATFDRRAGDHHDAIEYFGLGESGAHSADASDRGLLVINHESITPAFLHPAGRTIAGGVRCSADEVLREYYAHGVSVVEVRRDADGAWNCRRDSMLNRRVHTLSDIVLSGPAAGSSYMVTKYSADGTRTRGTVNNCAHGRTPWNTYLACEEHWAGYFRRTAADNPNRSRKELASLARYGVDGGGRGLWATVTPDTADDLYGRWNAEIRGAGPADDYRNGPNTYGWNVEIDPFDAAATPKKRTAMGRFAHEGAWPAQAIAGRPVVFYMGCDARDGCIYKYVSAAVWDPADATRGLAAGDKYLDAGTLYAARFDADGSGQWLELSFGVGAVNGDNAAYPFADAADALINAQLAADAQGATRMDRPEWGAVDPVNGAVYMTLTGNGAAARPLVATDAANPRHYNDVRTDGTAQRGNPNGHIIRWQETSPAATSFVWDIYLFGARAGADAGNVNLSRLTDDNDFSSPDGLWFSKTTGICWIETDDAAYTDITNCMLLAALPGHVGDGSARAITNTDANGATRTVTTRAGAAPGAKLKRFLVGPRDCEITGITETPDGRTLFVNIQHPGAGTTAASIGEPARFTSHWPDGGVARPRSATIAITRRDGGVVGA